MTDIWVKSPDGRREKQSPVNARDLINNANWVVDGDQTDDNSEAKTPHKKHGKEPVVDKPDPDADTGKGADEGGNADEGNGGNAEDLKTTEEKDEEAEAQKNDASLSSNAPPLDASKAPADSVEAVTRDIASLSKIELEVYAREHFGVDIDKRKTEGKLRAELLGLAEAKRVSPPGL